jgi:hypothetical protein
MKLNKAIKTLRRALPGKLVSTSDPAMWVKVGSDHLYAAADRTFVVVDCGGIGGHPDYVLRKDLEAIQRVGLSDTVRHAMAKPTADVMAKIEANQDWHEIVRGVHTCSYRIPGSTLEPLIRAAARNDIRYYLNGLCFEFERGRVIATDGHRLHAAFIKPTVHNAPPRLKDGDGPDLRWIVPVEVVEALMEAKATDYEFEFHQQGDAWLIRAFSVNDEVSITCPPVAGRFPDVDRVIPRHEKDDPAIDCLPWIDAAIAAKDDGELALKLDGRSVRRTGISNYGLLVDFGEGNVQQDADAKIQAHRREAPKCTRKTKAIVPVHVDPVYLIDALRFAAACSTPTLSVADTDKPIALHADDGVAIVMPRRA